MNECIQVQEHSEQVQSRDPDTVSAKITLNAHDSQGSFAQVWVLSC